MNDSLGLVIDFIFDEEKINKNAEILLDKLQRKSDLKLGFDFSALNELSKTIQGISNTKMVLDIEGKPLETIKTLELGMGRVLTVVEDVNGEFKKAKFDVNSSKYQKEILNEIDKTLSQMSKHHKNILSTNEDIKNVATEEYSKLNEKLAVQRSMISNDETRLKVQEKINNYDRELAQSINLQQANAKELLDTQKEIMETKIQTLKSGKLSDFYDDNALDKFQEKLQSISAFSPEQVKNDIEKLQKEFSNIELGANIEKGIYDEALSVLGNMAKKEKELLNVSKDKKDIVNQEYKEIEDLLNKKANELKLTKSQISLLSEIEKKNKNISNQKTIQNNLAQSILDKEKKNLTRDISSFQSGSLGNFASQNEINKLIEDLNSISAFSSKQVQEEINKIKEKFKDIKFEAKIEKGVFDDVLSIVEQMIDKEQEINKLSGDRQEIAKQEKELLSQNLQLALGLVENDNTRKLIKERELELSQQSQYEIEKMKDDAEELVELEQRRLNLRMKEIKESKNAEYLNPQRLKEVEQAISNLNGTSTQQVRRQVKELKLDIDELVSEANSLGTMAKSTNSAFSTLGNTLKTLGVYRSVEEMFQMLFNELSKGVEHIREVDKAFVNMSMTMESMTNTKFDSMINQIGKLSQFMGSVSSDILQLAQTYANDSTTISAVVDKLSASSALMNISGLDPDAVTSSVMSIANSYQLLSKESDNVAEVTEYLGDVLAKTSANMEMDFQAGLSGLVEGIGVAGSTMKSAGVDMEWFVGMLGNAMVSTGQSAEKLGRGMRTITARVMQQKQALEEMGESVEDVEIAMAQGEKALNELGITIRNNLSGELKPFSEIMDELGSKWDGLTDSTKYYLAEMLAGKNQMDIFIGMMDSYQNGLELVNNAYNAQGTLMEMNSKFSEGLEGKINKLTSAKEEFYRTIISSDALKSLIDASTSLINTFTILAENIGVVVETFGGLPSTIGLVTTAFIAYKVATSDTTISISGMINGVKNAITAMKTAKTSTDALTASQKLLSVACSGGVAILATLAVSGLGYLINYSERAKERTKELASEISSSYKDINDSISQTVNVDTLIKQYEELSGKISSNKLSSEELSKAEEELATTKERLLQLFPSAIQGYDEEGKAILNNIDYIKELNEAEKERLARDEELLKVQATTNYEDEKQKLNELSEERERYFARLVQQQEELQNTDRESSRYKALQAEINNLLITIGNLDSQIDDHNSIIKTYEEVLSESTNTTKGFNSSLDETQSSSKNAKSGIDDLSESTKTLAEQQREATSKYLETTETLEDARELLSDIAENGMNLDNANELFDMFEDYTGNITNASEAMEFLREKIAELEELQGTSYFEMLDKDAQEAYQAQNRAYLDMMADDENFWNQKLKNSEVWKNHVAESSQAIRDFNLKVLGDEANDFADFINEKLEQRQIDLDNAKTLAEAEKIMTNGLVNDLSEYFAQLINNKGTYRQSDYKNVIEFLNTQGNAEVKTIAQLRDLWQKFYQEKWKALDTELKSLESKLDVVYEGDRENVYSNFYALQQEHNKMQNLFNSLDLSFKNVGGGLSQSTVGLKRPSSSGSSGSSSDKEIADLELQIDRYYKLNDAIDDVNNKLTVNQKLQDNATTVKELLALLDEETRLINEKTQALQNLQREQEKDANELRSSLSSQGFTFDSEGNIINYAERLNQIQANANKLSGEAKENAIANANAVVDMINSYTTLTNSSIPSTKNELLDLNGALKDIQKTQEEITKGVERLGERYYNVLQSIKQIDNQLALINAKQENATASERVQLLNKEIELLKEKQKLLKQQQSETVVEVQELYQELLKQGVEFNLDGTIKNYDQLMKKLTDRINQLVNSARDDELESANELLDLIEKYDELVKNVLPDLGVEWVEINNEIIALEKSKLETIANMEKQITDAITSELQKRTDATKKELNKQKDLYLQQYEEEDYQAELTKEQRKLDEIQQQINNLARDTSLTGQLKLQELLQQYEEQQQNISNIIRDWEKQQGSDRFDQEMERLDEELEKQLDAENMAQMVAEALKSGFVTIGDEIINLDKLMADFAIESEGAITALSNTIRSEMIDSLEETKQLVQELGAEYHALVGMNEKLTEQRNSLRVADAVQSNMTSLFGATNSPMIQLGKELLSISGYSNLFQNIKNNLDNIKTQSKSNLIEFNAPLLNVEGDISQDIEDRLQDLAVQVQDTVMNTVSRALSTI